MSSIQQNRNRLLEEINFNGEKVTDLIIKGNEKISNITNKDITLVIGCTGSGKSTLINYLLNNSLRVETKFMGTIIKADDLNGKYPKIGHDSQSCTIFPEIFTDEGNQISYCDCPGFFDNRSFEERVSISLNIQSIILNANRIQAIIVVLTQSELLAQRGILFRSLNKLLNNLINDFESILSNIIFVLSRPNANVKSGDFYSYLDNEVNSNKNILEEKFKNILNKAKKMIDPETKERESQFKFLSTIVQRRENFIEGNLSNDLCRNQIISLIKSFKNRSISKENFNFNSYDQDRMNLNNFIYNLSYNGLKNIRNCLNYRKTSYEYDKFKMDINSKLEFYNKEKERLEKILNENKLDENTLIEEKKKKQEEISTRISTLRDLKKEKEEFLLSYQEEYSKIEGSLSELDTDEPCLYWSKEVNDKRMKFFGSRSVTKKTFHYDGIAFVDVKLFKQNGEFTNEKRHILKNHNLGSYSVNYKSEPGKDGVAKVDIYLKKRDLLSNAKQIKLLKEYLSELDEKIKASETLIKNHQLEIESLSNKNEELENNNMEINRNRFKKELEEIKVKIKEENKLLADMFLRASKTEEVYNESKELIKEFKSYFDMVEIINNTVLLQSSLVEEFINSYNSYNNNNEYRKENIESDNNSNDYYCPISKCLMFNPYVNKCGHSYEYAAVHKYIQENSEPICPICSQNISKESLVPNQKLNKIINDYWYSYQMSLEYPEKDNICNQKQFNDAVLAKEKLEDRIKKIRLELEEKEFNLKDLENQIEKWMKKTNKGEKNDKSTLIIEDQMNNKPKQMDKSQTLIKPSAKTINIEKPELPPKPKTDAPKASMLIPPPPPPPPRVPPISEFTQSNESKKLEPNDVTPKPSNIKGNLLDEINKFNKNNLKKVELEKIKQTRTNNFMKDLQEAAAKIREHVADSDSSNEYEEI